LKLKLVLIFSVIIVGFIFLAPDSFNPIKDKVAVIDKVGQNIDGLKNDIDSTIDNIGEKFDNINDSQAELFPDEEITGEQESQIADEYIYHGEITEDEPQTQDEAPTQTDNITPQDETPQDDGLLPQDDTTEEDSVLTEPQKNQKLSTTVFQLKNNYNQNFLKHYN
jgi:hypothetical protein